MSKVIKAMAMDALKGMFKDKSDFVFLSIQGMDSVSDNLFRRNLRKKNIEMQTVKNSLARLVCHDMGIKLSSDSPYWAGPTTVVWGASSISELSRTIDTELKDMVKKNVKLKDTVKFKGVVTEGQQLSFEEAKKLPTRAEAIGTIVGMVIGPASQIASQLTAAASQVASQVQSISEKKEEAAPAETPAETPA